MKCKTAIVAAVGIWAVAVGVPDRAGAQYCEGTVYGLSSSYDLAAGTGFLAVRSAPRASARKVGEFYNGNTTEILGRSGSWYRVAIGGIDGWASARYIRNSCGY